MTSNYKTIFTLIKIISVILITSALGLESWTTYVLITHRTLPSYLNPILWFERFAMTIHFIEGIVAAYKAPARNEIAINYAIYTFFVGTVGLLELFDKRDIQEF